MIMFFIENSFKSKLAQRKKFTVGNTITGGGESANLRLTAEHSPGLLVCPLTNPPV